MTKRDSYRIKDRPAPPAPIPRPRGLEDQAIIRQVKTVSKAFAAIGVTVPAHVEAAVQAYLEATKHPNTDVRITCSKNEELQVFKALNNADSRHGEIDWPKSGDDAERDDDPKHLVTIRFRNGSTIALRTR